VAFLDLLKPKRPFRGLRNGVDLFNKGLFGEFFGAIVQKTFQEIL
jgi:hypothetical protein